MRRGSLLSFLGTRSALWACATNQNASLIKEFKNTSVWWKEPSDWPKSSTNQNDRKFAGKNEMGRPENEVHAIFKKNIFFDMLLRRIKPNEIQKIKLHTLLFIWTLFFFFIFGSPHQQISKIKTNKKGGKFETPFFFICALCFPESDGRFISLFYRFPESDIKYIPPSNF